MKFNKYFNDKLFYTLLQTLKVVVVSGACIIVSNNYMDLNNQVVNMQKKYLNTYQQYITEKDKNNDLINKNNILLSNIEKQNKLINNTAEAMQAYYDKAIELEKLEEQLNNLYIIRENGIYTDLTTPTNFSGDDINFILADTNLAGLGEHYALAEQQTNINALFSIGISCLETGYGTSKAYINKNNTHGSVSNGKTMFFNSKLDSIIFANNNLKNNYYNQGLTNIAAVQHKYCPPNPYWDEHIERIIEETLLPKAEKLLNDKITSYKQELENYKEEVVTI